MKFKKLSIILLFLLLIAMLCGVSAASDFDDVAKNTQSDDKILQSGNLNDDIKVQSSADNLVSTDNSDKYIGANVNEDDNGILANENSNNSIGSSENEDVIGNTYTYDDLFDLIYKNGQTADTEITLEHDYVYNGDQYIWHGGINVKKNLIIHGNGHTIDGNGRASHFTITESASLTLYDLNLINGLETDTDMHTGGSIVVPSKNKLTAVNCNFINCKALAGGAISAFPGSTVTLTNCVFSDNEATCDDLEAEYLGGGVIWGASDSLTINNCKFIDNYAPTEGGAFVFYGGKLTVRGTLFSGNSANSYQNLGGAIYIVSCPSITIENSKFENNQLKGQIAQGGAITAHFCGSFTIDGCEFTDHSIYGYGAAFSSYNTTVLIKNSNFTNNVANGNIGGGAIYFGGERALTITNCRFTDNKANGVRGGAIYSESSKLDITESSFVGNTATNGSAIYCNFITDSISIIGSNFENNVAQESGAAVYAIGLSPLNIASSTFNSNSADSDGGAILAAGVSLTVTDSTFNNNNNQGGGGAIYAASSSLDVSRSTFNGNHAAYGGAIFMYGKTLTVSDSNFTGSEAYALTGGAIYGSNTEVNIINSNFTSCKGFLGGAIYVEDSTLDVKGSNLNNNNAFSNGGAIYLIRSTSSITHSNLVQNHADTYGGAMALLENSNLILVDVTVSDNSQKNLGAIYISDDSSSSRVSAANSRFNNNVATKNAGAIYCPSGNTLTIISCSFNNNNATTYGGALLIASGASADIYESSFNNNNAEYGGAIFSNESSLYIQLSTFSDNVADEYGGAIYSNAEDFSHSFKVEGSTFTNNYALAGGAIFVYAQNALIDGDDFNNNRANYDGGAIYIYETAIATVSNSKFTTNHANRHGGAVHSYDATLFMDNSIFNHNDDEGVYANRGLIKASIFMETDVVGGIQESDNKHYIPTVFEIANISSIIYGNSITLSITESHGFTGTVNITIGKNVYPINLQGGSGSQVINDLPVGAYKAIIDFPETGEYYSSYTESNEFTIKYQPAFEMAYIPTTIYGDPIDIDISEANGLTGTVTVTIGSFSYDIELINGIGSKSVIPGLDVGKYKVVLTFEGSDEFNSGSAESNEFILKYRSFVELNELINSGSNSIKLEHDYVYDATYDSQFANGIPISQDVVINGNGHVIDAKGLARIFDVSNETQATIEDITLNNGNAKYGGAIYVAEDSNLTVIGSNFNNNIASGDGGAIYSDGVLKITGSSFVNEAIARCSGVHANNGEIKSSSFVGDGVSGNITVSDDSTIMITPVFVIANIPDFVNGSSITIIVKNQTFNKDEFHNNYYVWNS